MCALPALWTGLLYDTASLDGALDLVKGWSAQERQALRDDVPRLGLKAQIGGRTVQDVAADVVALAREGLTRRRRLDSQGRDETRFLAPVDEVLRNGRTPAEDLLARYFGAWGETVEPIFTELAY